MKKVIALLLALMMLLTLAACSGSKPTEEPAETPATNNEEPAAQEAPAPEEPAAEEPAPEEPTEAGLSGKITYLTNRTDLDADGTYDALIAKFNEKYPDVKVEVQSITDYAGEMAIRMQTEEYGDVLMLPNAVPNNELGKYFEPFGTVEELSGKYREGYLYSKWFDNQVYGLAYMCTVNGVVYNKAVFEKAGITELPKSPEEFLDCLQKIKDNTDAIPCYTNANSGWPMDPWVDNSFGSATGNANYKNNEMPHDATAFTESNSHYIISKLLYDVVNRGLCEADPTTCDWEGSKLMINNGEIGCMVLGSWAIQQMKDAGDHADDIGYMPFPYSINGKQYATSDTDYCYAINVHSKNKEAARAFVEFLVDESGLALDNGGISLLKSDPMPAGLELFGDVEFVVNLPATSENEGLLDQVQQASGITLYDNGQRLNTVIDIARGASNQTFDEYMASLAEKWAAAVK